MCWVCMICVLASAGMCTCMWVWRPKINIQCLLQVGVCVRARARAYACIHVDPSLNGKIIHWVGWLQ